MLWNIWYYMLYLTISWCYGSKKIIWIQSILGLLGGGRGGHRFRTFSKILPIVFGGFPYNIFVVLYNQDMEIFAWNQCLWNIQPGMLSSGCTSRANWAFLSFRGSKRGEQTENSFKLIQIYLMLIRSGAVNSGIKSFKNLVLRAKSGGNWLCCYFLSDPSPIIFYACH